MPGVLNYSIMQYRFCTWCTNRFSVALHNAFNKIITCIIGVFQKTSKSNKKTNTQHHVYICSLLGYFRSTVGYINHNGRLKINQKDNVFNVVVLKISYQNKAKTFESEFD